MRYIEGVMEGLMQGDDLFQFKTKFPEPFISNKVRLYYGSSSVHIRDWMHNIPEGKGALGKSI